MVYLKLLMLEVSEKNDTDNLTAVSVSVIINVVNDTLSSLLLY